MLPAQWVTSGVRFTRAGGFFSLGTLAVGIAAVHSGNNLLFLLLGGMLGTVLSSGIVSSLMLRGLEIERRVVGPAPVQLPVLIRYAVRNTRTRLPSYAIELRERGLVPSAYVGVVPPGGEVVVEYPVKFRRRGTYPLDVLMLSTGFPFGLFVKVKRLRRPAELVVWPRNDRPVGALSGGGAGGRPTALLSTSAPLGARGEFRSLREYRPGDDRRDVHWRSSARAGQPVVREYLGDATSDVFLALDPRGTDSDASEAALETMASLATRLTGEGRRFGAAVGPTVLGPRTGTIHLGSVLTALARVDFTPGAEPPSPPPDAILFSEADPGGRSVGSLAGPAS